MNRLDGPALTADKLLHQELRARGVPERAMPEQLRNSIVAKSKKGPAGALTVRRMTGVVDNSASRIVRRFEANVGGKDDVVEKLEAVPNRLTEAERALLIALKSPTKKGLGRLMAEAGVEPLGVLKKYAEGCIELGKVEAAMEAHRNLPALVKRLYKMALEDFNVCGACGGTGSLHRKATDHLETVPCTFCEMTGKTQNKHQEFATRQLLEVTKQVEKGGVTVNTAVGVKVDGNGATSNVFEQIMKASDEVLFRRNPAVVEAEVVE